MPDNSKRDLTMALLDKLARAGQQDARDELLRPAIDPIAKAALRTRLAIPEMRDAALQEGLQHAHCELRQLALEHLPPEDRWLPQVAPLLADEHEANRGMAKRFIHSRRCQDPALLQPVLDQLQNAKNNANLNAAQSLQYDHALPQVRDALLQVWQTAEPPLNKFTGQALVHCQPAEETAALIRPHAPTPSKIYILSEIGTLEDVSEWFDHPHPDFQQAASEGLNRHGQQDRLNARWQELKAEGQPK